jgi:hypothetical protein
MLLSQAVYVVYIFCVLLSAISGANMFDGTYSFTSLGEKVQINVCTDSTSYVTYMSINHIDPDNRPSRSFVFGAFRDLNGPKEVDYNDYQTELTLNGYQMTNNNDFIQLTYKLRKSNDNKYLLIRIDNNFNNKKSRKRDIDRSVGDKSFDKKEIFILSKEDSSPLNECFMANYRFDRDIEYPIFYQSPNLKKTGICEDDNIGCYELESINDAELTDSCFVFEDAQSGDRTFGGGKFKAVDLVWDGKLSLERWEDFGFPEGDPRGKGIQMVVMDDLDTIVLSWKYGTSRSGSIYRLDVVTPFEECPLFEG